MTRKSIPPMPDGFMDNYPEYTLEQRQLLFALAYEYLDCFGEDTLPHRRAMVAIPAWMLRRISCDRAARSNAPTMSDTPHKSED